MIFSQRKRPRTQKLDMNGKCNLNVISTDETPRARKYNFELEQAIQATAENENQL